MSMPRIYGRLEQRQAFLFFCSSNLSMLIKRSNKLLQIKRVFLQTIDNKKYPHEVLGAKIFQYYCRIFAWTKNLIYAFRRETFAFQQHSKAFSTANFEKVEWMLRSEKLYSSFEKKSGKLPLHERQECSTCSSKLPALSEVVNSWLDNIKIIARHNQNLCWKLFNFELKTTIRTK